LPLSSISLCNCFVPHRSVLYFTAHPPVLSSYDAEIIRAGGLESSHPQEEELACLLPCMHLTGGRAMHFSSTPMVPNCDWFVAKRFFGFQGMARHVVSCHVVSCRVVSCRLVSRHVRATSGGRNWSRIPFPIPIRIVHANRPCIVHTERKLGVKTDQSRRDKVVSHRNTTAASPSRWLGLGWVPRGLPVARLAQCQLAWFGSLFCLPTKQPSNQATDKTF